MQSIGLVLELHNTQPPGTGGHDLRRAFERAYFPMLDAIDAFPAIRISMHWSGQLLEWMELHAPDRLERLARLAAEGRVEILGGLWGGGVLPALPERDVVGQVSAMTRWWRTQGEVKPRGAWLPYTAWDPSAARILGRMGLQFTVLEESQFSPPVVSDGYYLTEREGTALALFCADARLSAMIPGAPPERFLKQVALRARDGARCLVVSMAGEGFGAALDSSATHCFGPERGWVSRFFQALTDNAHWLKLVSFGTVIDRMRPTDRVYPPASISLPVSIAALGARGATYAEAVAEAMRGRDWTLERLAPFLRGGSWEQLLANAPEINRLHKRMLRASSEVARLRHALRDAGPADDRVSELEEATRALFRGQNGAAYVLGTDVGAQDPGVRAQAWASLLRAEYTVASALGELERPRVVRGDYDCDGRAEVLVATPQLCAILAPASGGALVELDAWSLPGNLLNVRTRRDEPEHAAVKRTENLPKVVEPEQPAAVEIEEDDGDHDTSDPLPIDAFLPTVRVTDTTLASRLQQDRNARASFLDHFLGPEATLQNVRLGRFPEAGDFVGGDYQLLKLEEDFDVAVTLARDGNVNEGAALRLVRVQKRFVFSADLPGFDVRYEIANRYHEPVRSRFAVEVNLGLDGANGPGVYLEPAAGVRVPLAEPGDHPDVTQLALVDENRGYRVLLSFHTPARVWHYPVETVSRTPRGLAPVFQGVCVLAWWPVELWGQERKRIDLTVSVEG